jgi:hypothetical protein
MSGSSPQKIVALLAVALLAMTAATARADDAPPAVFGGHGVTFSYPLTWQHIDGQFEIQVGKPLWNEFFAPPSPPPPPPPPPDPNQPPPPPGTTPPPTPTPSAFYDVIAISAYRLPIAITKKTLPRYKASIQAAIMQLAQRGGGSLQRAGTRVVLGGMPGYRFEITMAGEAGTTLASRIVIVFRKKIEYFFNCQTIKGGALSAEISSGCDQVTRSFRAGVS